MRDDHPQAMKLALVWHDDLMLAKIADSHGPVCKEVWDSFCVAFERASEAIKAVLDAQVALQSEPLSKETQVKVRIAFPSAIMENRGNDYFGQAANRVARLWATAHGGQTLVSQRTHELVFSSLPRDALPEGPGEYRLKDLLRPEHLHHLQPALQPAEFAPIRSLPIHPNILPSSVTTFIRREAGQLVR